MGASWRDIVADIARGLRGHLLAHPNLVALVATRPAVTPSMLGLIDESLGRLADTGLAPAASMELLDCVVAFTVGKVQGELRQPIGGADAPADEIYPALTPDAFPHVVAAMMGGYDWAPDVQFERGLGALLRGWTP